MKMQRLEKTNESEYYCILKGINGYEDLWVSAGLEVISSVRLGDYQGDLLVLLFDPEENKWAYATTGYGSCSGCDAFEACKTLSDFESLRDGLTKGLIWNTREEMLAFLKNHDWEGDYFGETEEVKEWVAGAIKLMEAKP